MYKLTFCAQDADGMEIKQMRYVMIAVDLVKEATSNISGDLYIQSVALHTDNPSTS